VIQPEQSWRTSLPARNPRRAKQVLEFRNHHGGKGWIIDVVAHAQQLPIGTRAEGRFNGTEQSLSRGGIVKGLAWCIQR
jgi:hypothetical protein